MICNDLLCNGKIELSMNEWNNTKRAWSSEHWFAFSRYHFWYREKLFMNLKCYEQYFLKTVCIYKSNYISKGHLWWRSNKLSWYRYYFLIFKVSLCSVLLDWLTECQLVFEMSLLKECALWLGHTVKKLSCITHKRFLY